MYVYYDFKILGGSSKSSKNVSCLILYIENEYIDKTNAKDPAKKALFLYNNFLPMIDLLKFFSSTNFLYTLAVFNFSSFSTIYIKYTIKNKCIKLNYCKISNT